MTDESCSNHRCFEPSLLHGLVAALVLLFVFVSGPRASAAEIQLTSNDEYTFHISLKGNIAMGDKDRLEAAMQSAFEVEIPWHRDVWLHLDSPGGNLKAGLEVIEYILENHIGTRIDKGAHCYSACALIFLSGNGVTRNFVETYLKRELHVGGTLGFHAPYVKLEGVGYNAAVKQIAQILTLLNNKGSLLSGKPFLKQSLMTELLLRGPNEIFNIDTVDKAGRWDIELTGNLGPRRLTLKNFKIACDNIISWKRDSYSSGIITDELEGKVSRVACKKWEPGDCKFKHVARLKKHGTQVSGITNDVGCDVTYYKASDYPVRIVSWEHAPPADQDTVGDLGRTWWFLTPETKLKSLTADR